MVSFEWLGWQEAAHLVASSLAPNQSSRAEKREKLGNIAEWTTTDLDYLALELEGWEPIYDAKRRLVAGAASGSIRTCDADGVSIHSAKWRSHKLVEPDGDLRLLRDSKSAWSESFVPLFNRADIEALIHIAKVPTGTEEPVAEGSVEPPVSAPMMQASAPTADSTSTDMGGMSRGDDTVPDPDLQRQFDAEKRRRLDAGEDHGYDAMTLWARHNLKVDSDTAAELWAHRSLEFPRRAGRLKSRARDTSEKG